MMKELNEKELQQVAGGVNWSSFRKSLKDGFRSLGDAAVELAHNVRDEIREFREDHNF
ncbi:bacteriocin [Neisseria chenwenguii]|nr:bacteriocin [Neisseria chenwenguii]